VRGRLRRRVKLATEEERGPGQPTEAAAPAQNAATGGAGRTGLGGARGGRGGRMREAAGPPKAGGTGRASASWSGQADTGGGGLASMVGVRRTGRRGRGRTWPTTVRGPRGTVRGGSVPAWLGQKD